MGSDTASHNRLMAMTAPLLAVGGFVLPNDRVDVIVLRDGREREIEIELSW